MQNTRPSLDAWLAELKADPAAAGVGMFLMHNGIVRATARTVARGMESGGPAVTSMELSFDRAGLEAAIEAVRSMTGIVFVRAWVNEGTLSLGDDIMYALVGGDIRENVFAGLQELVRRIKSEVVAELEHRS